MRSLRPDADYGTIMNYCDSSDWGDKVDPGDFYFAYKGGNVISARRVTIAW
ncbi:hypothetical protein AB0M57_10730 [Streptomyces sp. NPDC051597]|uniref:hypothetical protein n=1 Tax=Streptomyces sp. NPDC051597 TaxID=3155049 RepID=UPI003439E900